MTNFRLFYTKKEFADNNFEMHCGKGEIARNKQFLLFPKCFQKTCTADT